MLRVRAVSLPLVALVIARLPTSAHAMRIVSLDISVDGKPFLAGRNGDSGYPSKAVVWRYFEHIPLRPAQGVIVNPDADNPKRATIKGKIKLEARYGGTAEVDELHLVRTDASKDEWTVDRDDVQKLAETIGLGIVPVVPLEHATGNGEGQWVGEWDGMTESDFPWIWVIGVGVVIVALAGLAIILLLRGKTKSGEPGA
jgi:hypothetical protein